MKKTMTAMMAVFLVLASSIAMFGCYEKTEQLMKTQQEGQMHHTVVDYLYNQCNLDTMIYTLAYKLKNAEGQMTAETMLEINGSEVFSEQVEHIFNESYSVYWESHLDYEPNLHYYAMDLNGSNTIYNVIELNDAELENLNAEYQAVIEIAFDEMGNAVVNSYSSKEDSSMGYYNWQRLFNQTRKSEIENYILRDAENALVENQVDSSGEQSIVKLKDIKEMKFIFAIPNELEETGSLYYYTYVVNMRHEIQGTAAFYGIILCALVFVGALFFPIRTVSQWKWFSGVSKIKFELLVSGIIMLFIGCFFSGLQLCMLTLNGNLRELIVHFGFEACLNEITIFINLLVWGLVFFLVMFGAWMIRYIFYIGVKVYITTHTVLFWFIGGISSIIKKCKKLFDQMMHFDLEDPIHQIVLRIVIVNFLVMSACCLFFVAGNAVAIVYSVIVFLFLKKKLKEIQNDYLMLLDELKKVAKGNFNFTIEQDLGVFNSQRDALSELKDGFEKAVNEEVKSQRMKTELISNVSHDLKTPLTSIISYVDLLKKDDISEEERKEYIDTIDRNSQRLKNLITDLFDISKANSGNVSLQLQEVELISLINQVLFECQEKIEAAGLICKISCNSEKILLQLDSSKTYRIFENLIINITKYALVGTRVYIDVADEDEKVEVIIKNISANEIKMDVNEITERFVRGDKSRNTEGSGLGLAIVKSFMQLQNGEFNVEIDGDLFKAILIFKK